VRRGWVRTGLWGAWRAGRPLRPHGPPPGLARAVLGQLRTGGQASARPCVAGCQSRKAVGGVSGRSRPGGARHRKWGRRAGAADGRLHREGARISRGGRPGGLPGDSFEQGWRGSVRRTTGPLVECVRAWPAPSTPGTSTRWRWREARRSARRSRPRSRWQPANRSREEIDPFHIVRRRSSTPRPRAAGPFVAGRRPSHPLVPWASRTDEGPGAGRDAAEDRRPPNSAAKGRALVRGDGWSTSPAGPGDGPRARRTRRTIRSSLTRPRASRGRR
jgi:hypothetical protein